MRQEDPEKSCFQYTCSNYPLCKRARGMGCCIEFQEEEETVTAEECRKESGFLLFLPKNSMSPSPARPHPEA